MKFECIKVERTKTQWNIQLQVVENGKQVAAIQYATTDHACGSRFVPGGFYDLQLNEVAPT